MPLQTCYIPFIAFFSSSPLCAWELGKFSVVHNNKKRMQHVENYFSVFTLHCFSRWAKLFKETMILKKTLELACDGGGFAVSCQRLYSTRQKAYVYKSQV